MNGARLEETRRGLTVRIDNRYLYSRHDPSSLPLRTVESLPVLRRCIYFVPSPLLGYGLPELAAKIPEDSIIVTVEQSRELMALCAEQLLANIRNACIDDSRILNVRVSDKETLHTLLYSLGPWRFRRVHRIDLSSGSSLNPVLYDNLASFLLHDLTSYWRNRYTMARLGREWTRHIFANLSEIIRGETEFRNLEGLRINTIPVVVGAGPSLEQSMNFLRKNRDKLWIATTDTALPALSGGGIISDAVVVLDTQVWNLLDFHNSASSGIPVIADLTSYPPCLTHTGGPCYLYSSEYAGLNFLQRLKDSGLRESTIPPLGSVGLAALEIIEKITGGPVFLTGIDFSSLPGKSHARGTSFHHWQLAERNRLEPHPGWDASMSRPRVQGTDATGRVINTDAVLMGYAEQFKDRYASNNRLYILEPGGLDLGIPVITFGEAETLINDNSNVNTIPDSGQAAQNHGAASGFVEEELYRFNRIITAWNHYSLKNGTAAEVVNSLEGMDEIFADFPDEPPMPRNDDSFLVRSVKRVRQLKRYIERLERQGA